MDGVKEYLTGVQMGMAYWFGMWAAPWHKLREMRCRKFGILRFGCIGDELTSIVYQVKPSAS